MHGPRDALAYGVKITGATVIMVDAGVDTGVIIDQVAVPVIDSDTVEVLHERIKVAERELLVATVHRLATQYVAGHRPKGALGIMTEAGTEPMTEARTEPGPDALDADLGRRRIRRALVSVYDKSDLTQIGALLVDAGVELVSTGSTARTLVEAGLPVTPVEQVTGFAECLDGRVKTLHPHIHAGLLADLRLDSHVAQLRALGIGPFELLISNLYPFRDTVASGASPDECVDQIDIGGPAMVRGAAKNHACVAVIASPGAVPDAAARRSAPAASPWRSGRAWRRPPSRTPPVTTWPSPPGWDRS